MTTHRKWNYEGKVAFVTGAANGIGQATALLSRRKARMSSWSISRKKAHRRLCGWSKRKGSARSR